MLRPSHLWFGCTLKVEMDSLPSGTHPITIAGHHMVQNSYSWYGYRVRSTRRQLMFLFLYSSIFESACCCPVVFKLLLLQICHALGAVISHSLCFFVFSLHSHIFTNKEVSLDPAVQAHCPASRPLFVPAQRQRNGGRSYRLARIYSRYPACLAPTNTAQRISFFDRGALFPNTLRPASRKTKTTHLDAHYCPLPRDHAPPARISIVDCLPRVYD